MNRSTVEKEIARLAQRQEDTRMFCRASRIPISNFYGVSFAFGGMLAGAFIVMIAARIVG